MKEQNKNCLENKYLKFIRMANALMVTKIDEKSVKCFFELKNDIDLSSKKPYSYS